MSQIVPLSAGELLAFALICASFGVSIGIAIAGWIASRDPTTERRGTGHEPSESNPNVHHLPPASAPRLTPHERRRFRS